LDANPEIASRVDGRLERLGLSPEEADQQAGLPVGTVSAILRQSGRLPRGNALRRLVATLDVSEEFLLGLEPGTLSRRRCWRILRASWVYSHPMRRLYCGTTGAWTS
jgi:hypothetical protein